MTNHSWALTPWKPWAVDQNAEEQETHRPCPGAALPRVQPSARPWVTEMKAALPLLQGSFITNWPLRLSFSRHLVSTYCVPELVSTLSLKSQCREYLLLKFLWAPPPPCGLGPSLPCSHNPQGLFLWCYFERPRLLFEGGFLRAGMIIGLFVSSI